MMQIDYDSLTFFINSFFLIRTYFHFLTLKHLTGSTADTYLEYTQRNLPEGVSMKVIRHEVRRLFPSIAKPPHEQENV